LNIPHLLIEIVKILITTFIITTIVDIILMGFLLPRFQSKKHPSAFFIKAKENSLTTSSASYFEFQGQGGCAGFSSAFLLRHLGIPASGEETFKEVPFTYGGGVAFPKGITGFFKKKGIKMGLYSGNLNALKNEITKGNPVIVVIRSFPHKSYLHFACITAYDEEYFYLADSIKSWVNVDKDGKDIEPGSLVEGPASAGEGMASLADPVEAPASAGEGLDSPEKVYYNRKLPVKLFKLLWNTAMLKMPLYRNLFFVMK